MPAERGPGRGAVLLLAAAVALRGLYLLDFRAHSLYWDVMLLDAEVYHSLAAHLAAGNWGGAPGVFSLPPLYSYAVGLTYALAGARPQAVFVVQAALGVVNVLLVRRLATDLAGKRAGLIAGWGALLYGPFLFFESKLLSATVTLTLCLLLLLALIRLARDSAPRLAWLAPGALLGLLILTRPEMLLFVPPAAFWVWSRCRRIAPPLLLVLGAVLMLAPVAARNAREAGEWSLAHLVSSQGGITFYQANNPRAAGLYVSLQGEGFSGDPRRQADDERRIAEQRTGRQMSRAEVTRYWMARGWQWIGSDPAAFARLELKKVFRFLGSYEYSTEYILSVERESVRTLWLVPVPFGLLAALGLLGAWRMRREPTARLLALLIAANLGAVLAYYVSSRYRIPAALALIVLAAPEVARLADGLRRRQARAVVQTASVLLITLLLSIPIDHRHLAQEAEAHKNSAVLHYQRGELGASVAGYRRAVEIRPEHWRAHFGMGLALEALGDRDGALAAYRQALHHNRRLQEARQKIRALGGET